jgi:hypothetical protein
MSVVLQREARGAAGKQLPDTYKIAGIEPPAVFPLTTKACPHCPPLVAIPSDRLLAQSLPDPPVSLLRRQFETAARRMITTRWLPPRLDDARYVANGEGAYRVQMSCLYKIYDRNEKRVILQAFVGRLTLLMSPLPIPLPHEARTLIGRAVYQNRSMAYYQPYSQTEETVPKPVEAFFQDLVDSILADSAGPLNREEWNRCLRAIGLTDGGIELRYPTKAPAVPSAHGAAECSTSLWTNGHLLVATVSSTDPEGRLLGALMPLSRISVTTLPAVEGVYTRSEWTDPDKRLARTRGEATHQWVYIRIGLPNVHARLYRAWIPLAGTKNYLTAAQWDAFARRATEALTTYCYHDGAGWRAAKLAKEHNPARAVKWLGEQRQRCFMAVKYLESSPCPDEFAATFKRILPAARKVAQAWKIAWLQWQRALSRPQKAETDYESAISGIRESISAKGLQVDSLFALASDLIAQVESKIGIWVNEA